jgi:hypothetical protein
MTDVYLRTMLKASLIILLFQVFVQDMKGRTISVVLLAFLFLTAFTFGFAVQEGAISFAFNTALNLMFILAQVCLLSLYIFFRFRATSIFKYIGLGDLLFWVALCPVMRFPDFAMHFVASLLLALLLHTIFCRFSFYKIRSVPLAGLQGIYYSTSLLFQIIY